MYYGTQLGWTNYPPEKSYPFSCWQFLQGCLKSGTYYG
jgi:hypothetical protein